MEEEIDLQQLDVSLLETLDHILNRGLVISGEITISIAEIDLLFVGLNVLLGSVEAIRGSAGPDQPPHSGSIVHRPGEA
jgi:hypothetical protein